MASILQTLAGSEGFPRISIYIPTHPVFPEWEQDPIRFKNALREIENQLEQAGMGAGEIADLTAEATARVEDRDFWQYQDQGLAVFIEKGITHWLKLPATVDEITVVADRYHMRPLIHQLRDHGTFYVLTVSLGETHLLKGSASGLSEVKVEGLPSGIEKIRGKTDFGADVGFHNRDRGSQVGGADAPKYSALGESPEDYEDVMLDQYMIDITKAVEAHLAASQAPLVLAALPRAVGHLKQHMDYRYVLSETVAVDPQSLSNDDLHDRAWQAAQKVLLSERDDQRARITSAAKGSGTAFSENLEEIIRATDDGRVETVFLSPDAMVWGHYDPSHRVIRIDHEPSPENEDLLNLVALKTLAQGGDVRKLPDDMSGPVAALYRY